MGSLMLSEADMHEYVFYINVGEGIGTVVKGLAVGNGGQHRPVILRVPAVTGPNSISIGACWGGTGYG